MHDHSTAGSTKLYFDWTAEPLPPEHFRARDELDAELKAELEHNENEATMTNIPEFLKQARFWFALFAAAVAFAPRVGITFSQVEIGAMLVLIASAFNVAPPVANYIQMKAYEAKIKQLENK